MLLASQRFGAVGMLNQQAIFANVHLRIAMQMAETTVRSLTEFGPRGRNLIVATCNLPGKMVVNDQAGEDSERANVSGKAAFIAGSRRDELIHILVEKAQGLSEEQLPRRVVFNGEEQPDIIDNPQFFNLLQDSRWLKVDELERFARQPLIEGGLNLPDWFAVEHPHVFWLGQEFNVRGQSTVVVRRRTSENMLVIGNYNNTIRYGMLAATLAGLAVSSSPKDIKFTVIDRSLTGAQWSTVLQTACEAMLRPAGYSVEFTKDGKSVEGILTKLNAELERRRNLEEEARAREPSLFVLMTDLDTVDAMRRKTGTYGSTDSPAGELLRKLYVDAAPLGIHLILSFTGLNTLGSVIDTRRDLQNFRHRVALQMSEDESFTLVRSRKASQLQPDAKPLVALYFDMENEQKAARFKPYSTEPSPDSQSGSLEDQLREIGTRLSARTK
jgi:S-DNA-T family DNA segregation ATPase FtsK/SpoIIIE